MNKLNVNLNNLKILNPINMHGSEPRPIVQYTMEGQPLKVWLSKHHAAEELGAKHPGGIGTVAKHKNNRTSAYGYQWRYLEDVVATTFKGDLKAIHLIDVSRLKYIEPIIRAAKSTKSPVVQYNQNGRPIAVYASVKDAAAALGKEGAHGNILSAANIKSKNKSAYGFQWRYLKDVQNKK